MTLEVNTTLKAIGFGWFHVQMLLTSFFGSFSGLLITNITPYILPNAECDLDMNLFYKGVLAAIPYTGMMVSSVLAGFLTDAFGRKIFLVGGYGSMAFFNMISGLSQTYLQLVISKCCEGLVFAVAFNPTVTFTSEFCHQGIRDRIMLVHSSFVPVSYIILGLISWAILINNWKYSLFDGFLVLHTWNIYILSLTIFPILACTFYSALPESPKYLAAQRRYDDAKKSLIYVYRKNTGKPADSFPYADLWKQEISSRSHEDVGSSYVYNQLNKGLNNIKPMLKRPYIYYLMRFGCMNFVIMCLYNVIRMWFPQLSTIVEHYSSKYSELCDMLDAYTRDQRSKKSNTTEKVCVPKRSGSETYINSIVMGFLCLPPFFLVSLVVNRVGKKNLLVSVGLICVACCLGLRWANSKPLVVALFSIALSIGQVMKSLVQATVVEFFPTRIRSFSIAIISTVGRIGSLTGNILFPVLLNLGCVFPFFSLAGIMFLITVLALSGPVKKGIVQNTGA